MVQQVHTTKGGNMRRMKKAIAMGLATMMTISLAACGNTRVRQRRRRVAQL